MSKHSTISIRLTPVSKEESDILISQLSDIDYYAFQEDEGLLTAYIKAEDFNEFTLKKFLPNNLSFTKSLIKDQNWNRQWESDFQPVVVNNFAAVRAEFHEPLANVKHDLLITPKMSFGTGHHATTFMMIEQMEGINFEHKRVLDFGTGTGVLAILAEKLGATEIVAIDMDEWSINNTIENVVANNCHHIVVTQKNNLESIDNVDIILANINLNVLTHTCSDMASMLHAGGYLLASGFLRTDENKMTETFSESGFTVVHKIGKEIWSSLLFKKTGNQIL